MPPIRSSASKRCVLFISSITLDGEIISPCSCCVKKGLVCVMIMDLSGC